MILFHFFQENMIILGNYKFIGVLTHSCECVEVYKSVCLFVFGEHRTVSTNVPVPFLTVISDSFVSPGALF